MKYANRQFNKLVIISHTLHQIDPVLGFVGWGPTIREINYLSTYWNEVVHVACLDNTEPLGSSLPYTQDNIFFHSIPNFGGINFWDKALIILKIPKIIFTIHKALKNATEVQIRLPMSIGVFILPYFKIVSNKKCKIWIKYATNWMQPSTSYSYRFQHYLLKKNWINCVVTINGNWPNQPFYCKSFPNPCLTQEQYKDGDSLISCKSSTPPYVLIFVGRVDIEKGVDLIINSFLNWPLDKILKFHIVGEGKMLNKLKQFMEEYNSLIQFHHFIDNNKVCNLLKESHFLILPSKTEGFPKVIAESLNYACLPIVTRVGSISHYIKDEYNGFLMSDISSEELTNSIKRAFIMNSACLLKIRKNGRLLANIFTFDSYFNLLKKEVLNVY